MIYKQVDEDGKVIFTDQPRQSARTITSYPTAKVANRPEVDSEAVPDTIEPRRAARDRNAEDRLPSDRYPSARGLPERYAYDRYPQDRSPVEVPSIRPDRPGRLEPSRWLEPDPQPLSQVGVRPYNEQASSRSPEGADLLPGQDSPAPRRRVGDVERAVSGYAPLNTPLAAQIDANEAARRARQEASNAKPAAPILVVKPLAPEHDHLAQKRSLEFFYVLWVLTFVLMAAGLLYFGWKVLELILGRAFPRWHVGTG
jgi:hypothetical protein